MDESINLEVRCSECDSSLDCEKKYTNYGVKLLISPCEKCMQSNTESMYEDGYDAGFDNGFTKGKDAGYDQGFMDGEDNIKNTMKEKEAIKGE